MAKGLLLDLGGVVLQNGAYLVNRLAQREPRLQPYVRRVSGGSGIAGQGDQLWQQMLRHEVTERAYWACRAAELGAELGQTWDTRAMITALYDMPRSEWLVQPTIDLMRDTKAAGLPLGALTNDLQDFHGQDWVRRQDWLRLFDVVVDASLTGVMKPAPEAFAAGAEALGLARPRSSTSTTCPGTSPVGCGPGCRRSRSCTPPLPTPSPRHDAGSACRQPSNGTPSDARANPWRKPCPSSASTSWKAARRR